MGWTIPKTWVDDEYITDSMLNVHIRDNMNYLKTEVDKHSVAVQADVTGSRAYTTVYTNGSFIRVAAITTKYGGADSYVDNQFFADTNTPPSTQVGRCMFTGANQECTTTIIIPPEYNYRVTKYNSPTISAWVEWDLMGAEGTPTAGTWTTPKLWKPREMVTHTMMNTDVRDNLLCLKGLEDKHADWEYVSPGTSYNTVYQNTSGKIRFCFICAEYATTTSGIACYCAANDNPTTLVAKMIMTGLFMRNTIMFIIPNGYYYKFVNTQTPTVYVFKYVDIL